MQMYDVMCSGARVAALRRLEIYLHMTGLMKIYLLTVSKLLKVQIK